jgi:hypothetical protein
VYSSGISGMFSCCERPKLISIQNSRYFRTRQMLEKKWEYSDTVHQLFTDFKKAYDSVRRVVLYNILIELVYP